MHLRIVPFFVLFSTLLSAQESVIVPAVTPTAVITLPSKSPVLLEFTTEVSSKTALKGSQIAFVLAEDILANGQLLVAKGTPVIGEVIHAQKSGFGGRGGELILAARYIQHGEQQVSLRSLKPLAGPYAGKNHSDAAFAVSLVPYAGLVSLFITGGEIVIPAGTKASALTAVEAQIAVPPVTRQPSQPPSLRDL